MHKKIIKPNALVILAYHRITRSHLPDPMRTAVTIGAFSRQLDSLAARFKIISLTAAQALQAAGSLEKGPYAVLTFDDGYRDNYENAFAILKNKGLPATFFLVTDYLDGKGSPFWDWRLFEILMCDDPHRDVPVGARLLRQGMLETRRSFILRVFAAMKTCTTAQREEIINVLSMRCPQGIGFGPALERPITWEEAADLSQAGMEIGAHGLTHRSLALIPEAEAVDEIRKGKEIIEGRLKKTCAHFAFPFGSRRDYSHKLIECVRQAGYKSCLLNVCGVNDMKRDSFCFRRMPMTEETSI